MINQIGRLLSSLSLFGVCLGMLFFSASLTPSLLPRPYMVQGILSGVAFMTGYSIGWGVVRLWHYMGMPSLSKRFLRAAAILPTLALAGLVVFTMSSVTAWQNTLRSLMEMPPVASAHPLRIVLVAIATSTVILLVSRGLLWCGTRISDLAAKFLPRRMAGLFAFLLIIFTTVTLFNDVVLSRTLRAVDEVHADLNEFIEPDVLRPTAPQAFGSDASFFDWRETGRRGREFIVTGPTADEISAFKGAQANTPVRVYAGYEGYEDIEAQAERALQELIRLRAFDRSVLIVATPTGTGWMDPAAVDTVEFLHNGDTAIVALQYSYLPSWTTLFIDPDRSRFAARALFLPIYNHWRSLPVDARPKFYLFGLSLGALGSEHSTNFVEMMNEPIDGALWSGPPFPSTHWRQIMTSDMLEGPAWLPRLKDNRLVRFAGPEGTGTPSRDGWGRMRLLYLQHASDPMSFFAPDLLLTSPRWLIDRGPDVSPDMRWFPFVLFFQVGFDILLATSVPIGYGHNFAPGTYIDGWLAVTDPPGWDDDEILRLKKYFSNKR